MTLTQIQNKASKNWQERITLIQAVHAEVTKDPSLRKKINQVDKTFMRKLTRFPGDITTHRIAKVLEKIG